MNKAAIIVLTTLAALSAPAAHAAGSGGASGLPSSSRPAVDPAAAYQEGVEALKAKDYKQAEKKFGDVLSVAPANPEANYFMALAKIGNGKQKNAVRYLEKAIKERANFVEAREKLALVSIELGDADAARAQLTAIEGLKAECAAAGDCEGAYNARVDTAISRINEALAPKAEAAPTAPEPAKSGDEAPEGEGADDQQASLFFAPREEGAAQYMAAVRLINEAKYSDAIADLYKAQAIVGPHPDILNYLGYSHRKLGMMEKAQDYYAQALKIDPDHKGANEYLGELYLEIGDIAKAKKQLARLDALCGFGCAEREDLARLIDRREGALAAK
ncbi:MAG: tetratricopeptide repeat protein [Pseudomonadota bacterium]